MLVSIPASTVPFENNPAARWNSDNLVRYLYYAGECVAVEWYLHPNIIYCSIPLTVFQIGIGDAYELIQMQKESI